MGGPTGSERGTDNRGTANRYGSTSDRSIIASLVVWEAVGDEAIPDALADGLEYQKRFEAALRDQDFELLSILATRLLRDWQFLRDAQSHSLRAPDGALLVTNRVLALRNDAPRPVWAPKPGTPSIGPSYPRRPLDLSQIPPFFPINVRQWVETSEDSGPRMQHLENTKPRRPIEPKAAQAALDQAEQTLRRNLINLQVAAVSGGPTPVIDRDRANLSLLTLRDISSQTHVPITDTTNSKLLDSVEIILFHGASFSVVLDRFGEPTKLRGHLQYPILVSEPGHILRRNVPSPGLYVSVQKYGFSTFKVNGSSISKAIFGGVGGFDEKFGGGVVDRHEFHKQIQAYMDGYASQPYVAGIALESASNPVDITVGLIANKLPDVALRSIPYAIAAIRKLISRERLQETLKTIAEEVVKQILITVVREKVIEFVIKKLGAKLVPFINAVFAVADFVGGEDERRRVRNALGALMLALGGRTSDEDEIAAKVLGEIMAEEFQQAVIQALTKMALNAMPKGSKPSESDASEPAPPEHAPETSQPHPAPAKYGPATGQPSPALAEHALAAGQAHPAPHPQDAPPAHSAAPPADTKLPEGIVAGNKDAPRLEPLAPPPETREGRRGVDDAATVGTREEMPAATQPAVQATEEPKTLPSRENEAAPARATDRHGTESQGTEGRGTEDRGILQIGIEAIRGQPHEESTAPGRGTEDTGAIMRIGNDSVGVHERTADPLTTRRRLHEDMPETGTAMGFQTQVGREVVTAIGAPGHAVKVTSRNPDVLIGADQGRFRRDTLAIIAHDPNHPMHSIYDPTTGTFLRPPYQYGNLKQWQLHPYDWQAGHPRSHKAKGFDVVVFQSRHNNQEQSARFERHGDVTKDEVYVIGGIAVEKMTAWDLYATGYLNLTLDQMNALPVLEL